MRRPSRRRNIDIPRVVTLPAAAAVAAGLLSVSAHTGYSQSEHVRAELVANVQSIRPGSQFLVAVRFEIEDDWHLNWINPGDAGLAPSVGWKLPNGFRVSGLMWPYPSRFRIGPLIIYGYDRELMLMARVTPPEDLATNSRVEIAADVDWLACAEACVPGGTSLSLTLPVRSSFPHGAEEWKSAFEKTQTDRPKPSADWRVQAYLEDEERIVLEIRSNTRFDVEVGDCWFFPLYSDVIEHGDIQTLAVRPRGFDLTLKRARMSLDVPERITGVLVSDTGWDERGTIRAISIDVLIDQR
jgi:thiol:disulfide interchange protein DsbD